MRFFYLRNEHGHPIGCLASDLERGADDQERVKFAVSVCNPLDQFNRDQARALAAGRLFTGDWVAFPVTPEMKGSVKKHILSCVAHNPLYPQRAREAAKLWLSGQVNKA